MFSEWMWLYFFTSKFKETARRQHNLSVFAVRLQECLITIMHHNPSGVPSEAAYTSVVNLKGLTMFTCDNKLSFSSLMLPGLLFLSLSFHLLHLHGVWLASPHEQVMVTYAEVQDLQNIKKRSVQGPLMPLTDQCVLTRVSVFCQQQNVNILSLGSVTCVQ